MLTSLRLILPKSKFPSKADTLEGNFDLGKINRSEVKINGGIENDGQTISLELAPYPLPLRYINEYKKLIHVDQQIEVFSYLIFESNKISRSKLKIVQLPDLKDLDSQIQNFYEIEKNWKAPEEDNKTIEKDAKTSTKK
ncbi:hypothetical protein ATX63_11180 [Oenococcus oeni]|uniref:hypothetical protein n=1 Tax=Oenococcus oeni TaxID=1247 RepID=UPI0009514487|nr:hypothetical protein [Oenococcus oeni]OLQ37837.1 hypothetical protein ATX63_11180 [Oenococcus oeni]